MSEAVEFEANSLEAGLPYDHSAHFDGEGTVFAGEESAQAAEDSSR